MSWSEVVELNVKFPYQFHLHGLSDLQIGSQDCSERVIKQRVQEIVEDPVDSGIVVLGDIEDEDRPSTRERRKASFADRPEVIDRDAAKHLAWIDKAVIPLLLPLQRTKWGILGVLAGHHWTNITAQLSSPEYICNRLGELSKRKVPYLGQMSSFLDLRFKNGSHMGNVRAIGHLQHGEGGGQTKGSTLARLDRTAQGFEADFYMRAHDCQLVATKTDKLYAKQVKPGAEPDIMAKTIPMLNLGSATQGYQPNKRSLSYIEQSMMRPTTMGWGEIQFNIRKAWQHEDPSNNYKIDYKVLI